MRPSLQLKKPLEQRGRYFLSYTVIFLALACIIFSPFLLNGKSLIWKPDGLTQHFNSLVYFSNWGKQILHTFLTERRLEIPLWDFSIGYGSDILTTLHYYVIGDPLNLLALLVPVRYMEYLYDGLILLRLYLAGIAFSCYCFRMNRGNTSTLAGALAYAFCGYSIVLSAMHPYFINPLIYLPLLLIGIERVFHKESGHLLIVMTAISAVSNFYFFYMLVLLVIIYCVIRFLFMKHSCWWKELLSTLGRTLAFSLTGTVLAGFMLLPILIQFLSDSRSDSTLTYSNFYGWAYFEQLFDSFVSLNYTSSWTYLGFTGIALLCVFLLFLKRKQFASLKAGFLFLTVLLMIPAAGSFFNGFSYVANRWCFGYAFLISLILVYLWPELFHLTVREKFGVCLMSLVYLVLLLIFRSSGSSSALFSVALVPVAAALLSGSSRLAERPRLSQQFMLLLLVVDIACNAIYFYRLDPDSHLGRFVDAGEGFSTLQETASGMESIFIDQSEFFRSAQDPVPVRNDSLNYKVNTIQYYWSLSNGAITDFFNELAMPFHERPFKYSDLNYRAYLHALAGVRYYIRHDASDYVPYPYSGFSPYEYLDGVYFLSETDDYLPLGYTYDSCISRETYESLSYLQRQQALLQGVVCDSLPEGFSSAELSSSELSFSEQEIPFEISYSSDILNLDGAYYATSDNAQITLSFEGLAGCETYLVMEGLQASALTDLELYTQEPTAFFLQEKWDSMSAYEKQKLKQNNFYDTGISRFTISCESDVLETDFSYYAGLTESSYDRSDFLINMGYTEDTQKSITLTLPYKGVYSFRNLAVLCLPMTDFSQQLASLKEDTMEQITIENNSVTGTISLDSPKLLCLSIPYSTGWTALVDGQSVPLIRANTMYMALPLEEGEHMIELCYQTPGLKHGILLSCTGAAAWLLYALFHALLSRRFSQSHTSL